MRDFLLVFVLLQALLAHAQDSIEPEAVRQDGYYFTNPLLDCEPKLAYIPPFQQELSEFIAHQFEQGNASRISVHFRQLNNGYSFGINDHFRYSPASLLKVADAVYIMKLAEANPKVLEDTIRFEKRFDGSDSMTRLVIGKAYKVKTLIYHMLVYSDNEAKTLLQLHFNNGLMWKEVFTDLGLPIKIGAAFNNVISPRSYSILFRVLYNASYLNRKSSQIILKILSKTTFRGGVKSGIKDNQIIIANKFGFRKLRDRCQLHESAIIYLKGNPYLISVMTEGNEEDNLYGILQGISSLVYSSCKTEPSVNADTKETESLIHPMLDCSSDIEMLMPFKQKVMKVVQQLQEVGKAQEVSVYFKHLPTGHGFVINDSLRFSPASTMKVAHMMSILKGSEGDPESLNQMLSLDDGMFTRYQNIQDSTISISTEYTLSELLERTIIYSDNLAADLLTQNILNINSMWSALFRELGLAHVLKDGIRSRQEQTISTRELSLFFRVLYNATYLNREYSEFALGILARSRFQDGIRAGISDKNVIVASKFGERSHDDLNNYPVLKELHDAGIVYYEQNPYILCVMTKGYSFDQQSEAISVVSKVIYEEMTSQFPVN